MKIGLYTDPHFSQYSNLILSSNGYSGRLNNLIASFKWANKIFKEKSVEMVFCLGDLTDRPTVTAEEMSALRECNLTDHYFIVGNHCRLDKDGSYNTVNMFEHVYYNPQKVSEITDSNVYVLPYNSDLIDLKELKDADVILSHNDISNYDFGEYISKAGYEIEDILENCKLFINGHLHRGEWLVPNRIINLGSISGINFSTCEGEWNPSIGILDTTSLKIELIENPHALKFRKFKAKTLIELQTYLNGLNGNNYVVQIKIPHEINMQARKILDNYPNIIASRVLSFTESIVPEKAKLDNTEHMSIQDKLYAYILNKKPENLDMAIFKSILGDI